MANMQQLTKFDWARPSPLQGVGARRGELAAWISILSVFFPAKNNGGGATMGAVQISFHYVFFQAKEN